MSSDDRTRSVRELARRVLRSRGVIVRHPREIQIIDDLAVKISDNAPSLNFGVVFRLHDSSNVFVEIMGESGGCIGDIPQTEDEVWIPPPAKDSFDLLISEILALARAGYPGCLGCGGPDAEEEWDEAAARLRLSGSN